MDKPPAAFGDLQLVHAADNRSGQLMWYIKRSVLFVIDSQTAELFRILVSKGHGEIDAAAILKLYDPKDGV